MVMLIAIGISIIIMLAKIMHDIEIIADNSAQQERVVE